MSVPGYYIVLQLILAHSWNYAVVADSSPQNIEGQQRTAWWSQPYDHECLQDCAHETVNHTPSGDVSIPNRNCTIQCTGTGVRHRRYGFPPNQKLKRVVLKNPLINGVTTDCLIQILTEDIMCVTVTIQSGVRKVQMDSENRCHRRNYRYYLPHQNCDDGPHPEVGEETCREACVSETYNRGKKVTSINVARQRAIYRTCYKGTLSESYGTRTARGRYRRHFCRAEMKPCSACFRWGNWSAGNQCSKTCGSPGIRTFFRSCFIMERTGLYGDGVLFKPITSAYCKEYFGGIDKKTEQCGSYTACPGWTQWGPWSGCSGDELVTSPHDDVTRKTKRGCRRMRRYVEEKFISPAQNGSDISPQKNLVAKPGSTATENTTDSHQDGLLNFPQNRKSPAERRKRTCLPVGSDDSLCQGNSTELRLCDSNGKSPTLSPDLGDLDDCDDEDPTTVSPTNNEESTTVTSESGVVDDVTVTSPESVTSQNVYPDVPPKQGGGGNKNQNFTLSDDGFTNVIHTYAPALIAGLLVFIVLLLVALIAICGARVMQKNRRSRYDMTSPSFSNGTMGSIPSGLVHGFSHVLGLRHGSGTFGRSECAVNGFGNVSEAMDSRGSCRSIASNANSKGKPKQQHVNSGLAYASNPICQNQPHQRIAMTELGKRPGESSMGSKKPSNSSLLSSGSSACGPPPSVPPHHCSFQPLPPLPPNHPPHPVGNDNSVFKRGTKKSASLNPVESDRGATYTQPRAESVSGRVTGRKYDVAQEHSPQFSRKFPPTPVRRNTQNQRPDAPPNESYCQHDCEASACDVTSHAVTSENEYWSVSRPGCLESEGETTDSVRSSNQNTPRAKPRDKKNIKSNQTEKARENYRRPERKFKTSQKEGSGAQVELIDNVLYAQRKTDTGIKLTASERKTHSSKEDLASCDEATLENEEERFYNTIGMEEPEKAPKSGTLLTNEDDYDHLCDQFGGPHSTKGRAKYPGTMTSLHFLREASDDVDDDQKSHDYESIEFEGRNSGNRQTSDCQDNLESRDTGIGVA